MSKKPGRDALFKGTFPPHPDKKETKTTENITETRTIIPEYIEDAVKKATEGDWPGISTDVIKPEFREFAENLNNIISSRSEENKISRDYKKRVDELENLISDNHPEVPGEILKAVEEIMSGNHEYRINTELLDPLFKDLGREINNIFNIIEEEKKKSKEEIDELERILSTRGDALDKIQKENEILGLRYKDCQEDSDRLSVYKKAYEEVENDIKKLENASSVENIRQYAGTINKNSLLVNLTGTILEASDEITGMQAKCHDLTMENDSLNSSIETFIHDNPLPILILNRDMIIEGSNNAFSELSGIQQDKLKGRSTDHFRILKSEGSGVGEAFSEGIITSGTIEIEFPSGLHTLEQICMPIKKAGSIAKKLYIQYHDITEHYNSAILSDKLRRRYDSFVENNPIPVLLSDNKSNIIYINQAFLNFSGMSENDLLKMSLSDLKVTDKKGERIYKGNIQKKPVSEEVEITLPSGKHIVEQHCIPVLDEAENFEIVMTLYNDISKIRSHEKEKDDLILAAERESERLTESAEELGQLLATLSEGNLSINADISDNDPLVKIKKDFNISLEKIRGLITILDDTVDKVGAASSESRKGIEDMANAIEHVAISSQDTAENIRIQMVQIEEIGGNMSDLSASIQEIAGTSNEVLEHSKQAGRISEEGAKFGRDAGIKIKSVVEISEQTVSGMERLNAEILKIGDIARTITDISNQTNMLSLNAAIEAARAGEHGRGFAVVAGEVRNLASQVKGATQEITDLISSIQEISEETAGSLLSAHGEIQETIDFVENTVSAMDNISAAIDKATEEVEEIAKSTDTQAEATGRVMQSMEEANRITKENLKRAEDMAAINEEIAASSYQVNKATGDLTGMTESLKTLVNRFELGTKP